MVEEEERYKTKTAESLIVPVNQGEEVEEEEVQEEAEDEEEEEQRRKRHQG